MKSNKPLYLAFTLLLAFCIYNFYETHKPKVMCIDLVKILGGSREMKDVVKEHEMKGRLLAARQDTIIEEFQNEIRNFEKQEKQLSEKEKKDFSDRINLKQSQFSEFKRINQEKIEEYKVAQTQKVLNKINKIAKDYAESHGYLIVLGATGSGNVVYLNEKIDVTEDILKLLNNE